MPSYSKNEVVLVRYPFSNLSGSKVRPAAVVNAPHASQDVFVVPLTSKVSSLLTGEFVLADWNGAGLNVPSAAKRGLYTLHQSLVVKSIGHLSAADALTLENSLRGWLGIR
jgi:mRNA interferase MazF